MRQHFSGVAGEFAEQVVLSGRQVNLMAARTHQAVSIGLVYAIVFAIGIASAFEGPARQVLLPATVPRNMFSRAIVVNSTLQSTASVTGPALGGLLIYANGLELAYAIHGVLMFIAAVFALIFLTAYVIPWMFLTNMYRVAK